MTDISAIADIDYSKLEARVLAALISNENVQITAKDEPIVVAIDPASPTADRTAVLAALYGCDQRIIIIDEGHLVGDALERRWAPIEFGQHEVTGTLTAYFEDEKLLEAFRGIKDVKPEQPGEFRPDNRKQRRIDEAKERRKPRGQRRRMILDIETYDPNRTKDWLR